jgi:UDP-N-acetylmuramate dehydrogenase
MIKKFNGQENVALSEWTTFKIGGPARYFLRAKSEEELLGALGWAEKIGCPVFVLGGGSNLLVSDDGYSGLVIQMSLQSVDWQQDKVVVGSGVALSWLVKEFIKRGLSGLEWEAAIPGTVGGAVCGNAGAPDHAIGHLVEKIDFIDRQTGKTGSYCLDECCFDYRQSIFKNDSSKIITSVSLLADLGEESEIKGTYFNLVKQKSLTQPRQQPSAGCVFKNPPNQSAGMLIDQAGLKGFQVGQAQVSERHANFIVNLGGATSLEVMNLIELIKERIWSEAGLKLEQEITFLN